ncbi:MAG: hypothetical protein JNK38_01015 [Acidobacteria bacterium]|nr:hypothetical protein [Acidobacteriota bacterium]
MAKCFICSKDLTNPEHAARGYGEDCQRKYQTYLASAGTSEAELAELDATGDEAVLRRVRNFRQSLGSGRRREIEQTLAAARREAGHLEATQLGLTEREYFDYVDRRAAGEPAAELKAEVETANQAIALERERYLAEGAIKIVHALMEQVNHEVTRIKDRDFIAGHSTDTRNMATGLQTALVIAIAHTDLPTDELIAVADRQGWLTTERFLQQSAIRIHQERTFRQGIERRLLADAPAELKRAA